VNVFAVLLQKGSFEPTTCWFLSQLSSAHNASTNQRTSQPLRPNWATAARKLYSKEGFIYLKFSGDLLIFSVQLLYLRPDVPMI